MRALLLLALVLGCETKVASPISGLHSLRIDLTDPAEGMRGAPGTPVSPTELGFDVTAIDTKGRVWERDLEVDVYLSFAGEKVGTFTACGKEDDAKPLARVKLVAGRAEGQRVKLQKAFGLSALWVEDPVSHAIGSTPPIWFANPTIPDVNLPLDVASPTALYCSPFAGKHVTFDHGTGNGLLVVSSLFINGYVLADTGAPFDRLTEKGGFNHLFIFTFGKPPAAIVPGRRMNLVSGNLSKFVGFTELNFPLQEHIESTPNPALVPPPVELTARDRGRDAMLMRLVAATVKVSGKLCPIDPNADDWRKFNNFGLDLGGNVCDAFATFRVALPGKTLGNFDPLTVKTGTSLTVTGMLRNFSGQNEATTPPTPCAKKADCEAAGLGTASCVEGTCKRGVFVFWTVSPRDESDVTINSN